MPMPATSNHRARRKVPLALTVAVASATLAGCGAMDGAMGRVGSLVTPYRHEVVQGNFVSKEQVDALRPGMSRQQVRDTLGTPLLTSVFHADRWDYVFTLQRQNVGTQQFKLALFFKGDLLERFDGDTMPTETEFIAKMDVGRKIGRQPLLEVPEEVLKEFDLKNPRALAEVQSVPAGVAGAAVTYPPL